MATAKPNVIFEKLDALRTELIDLAFTLECRGQLDAADVVIATSARVSELCEELVETGLAARPAPKSISAA